MSYERSVKIGEDVFNVRAITARQMRDSAEELDKDPNMNPHTRNFNVIANSLNNYCQAHKELGQPNWTADMVSDLPWPVYKELNDVVAEVSGFSTAAQGNVPATVLP
jgi:hypothetical protein